MNERRNNISQINSDSVAYWDACYWNDGPAQKISDALVDVASARAHVKEYWDHRNNMRWDGELTGEIFYEELLGMNLKGLRVLDFGCGMGVDAFYMTQAGANVIAVDIVPANVKLTVRVLENTPSHAVLLKDYNGIAQLGAFDLVLLNGVLQHIQPNNVQYVAELLKRSLKPGGVLLCMVYTMIYFPYENACSEGPYARGYNIKQLRDLFSGLKLAHVRVFNQYSYMWVMFVRDFEITFDKIGAEMNQDIDVRKYQALGPPPPHSEVGPQCGICGKSTWIELGGGDSCDAYHPNFDVRHLPGVDVVCDLSKGIVPLHDDHADRIKMIHVINHMSATAGEQLLRECYRVLRPGGILFVMVTDIEFACQRVLEDGLIDRWAECFWGTRGNTYDADYHLWGYTRATLEALLLKVGFRETSYQGKYNAWEFKMIAVK